MLWVSASMPVAAVIDAGSSMVSSGSASTASASRCGEKMIRLTWVTSSEITALRPTSLPVPAVVGMATRCGTGPMGRAPGISSSYSNRSPGWVAMRAIALATSSAAPPPTPTIESAPCAGERRDPGLDLRLHRVAPHPVERLGLEATGRQVGHQVDEDRQRADALVGDDQRAADVMGPQVLDEQLAGAGPERDGGREAEPVQLEVVEGHVRILPVQPSRSARSAVLFGQEDEHLVDRPRTRVSRPSGRRR